MLDKIKQDWFHLGWDAAMTEEQKWRARRGEQMVEFPDHRSFRDSDEDDHDLPHIDGHGGAE